jgi:hypothetical protein
MEGWTTTNLERAQHRKRVIEYVQMNKQNQLYPGHGASWLCNPPLKTLLIDCP